MSAINATSGEVATGFIAGVTIVFGITTLGVAEGFVKPYFGPRQ